MQQTRVIQTVDVQVTGETGRILMDEHHLVHGETMAERLQYCREHLGWLRHAVLREPRGHANLMGVIVTPPVEPESDFGVIIMEQADFAPLSGANLMCAVTAMLETKRVAVTEPVTHLFVDTASGTVPVAAQVQDGRVTEITIESVPCFALQVEHALEVPEFGEIPVDVGFGGQFYVQAPAEAFGLELTLANGPQLVRAANILLAAAREQISVVHPTLPHLNALNLPLLYGQPDDSTADGKGVVVMPLEQPTISNPNSWSAGTIDRSPGGTGTCTRMAIEHAKGNLSLGQEFVQQSLLGTTFTGRLDEEFVENGQTMFKPTLTGRGWLVAQSELIIHPDDPFQQGFTL